MVQQFLILECLLSNQVMEKVAAWGPIVTGGIFAATLSSALASLVGAPKTFQALCKDELFPGISYFGVGVSRDVKHDAFMICIKIACHPHLFFTKGFF